MHRIPISTVQIGSVLAEPIVANGNILYPVNTVLTVDVKEDLLKFDIQEVVVKSYLDNLLHEETFTLEKLSDVVLSCLRHLSIEDTIAFATLFVQDVLNSISSNLLLRLYAHDVTTYQHSVNVAHLACLVGIHCGLSSEQIQELTLGALLHDVGKFNTPLHVLNKNGRLTPSEYSIIKMHPQAGISMLRATGEFSDIVEQVVLEHHENYDGTGYPCRKSGDDISLYGQIVHICDVYEALCSVRPYKEALSKDVVRGKMYHMSGTMFNPKLLALFMRIVPVYTLGEVLNIHGHTGIVITEGKDEDAIVSCNNVVLNIREFYAMQEFNCPAG